MEDVLTVYEHFERVIASTCLFGSIFGVEVTPNQVCHVCLGTFSYEYDSFDAFPVKLVAETRAAKQLLLSMGQVKMAFPQGSFLYVNREGFWGLEHLMSLSNEFQVFSLVVLHFNGHSVEHKSNKFFKMEGEKSNSVLLLIHALQNGKLV